MATILEFKPRRLATNPVTYGEMLHVHDILTRYYSGLKLPVIATYETKGEDHAS